MQLKKDPKRPNKGKMLGCLLPVACYEAQDSVSSHLPVVFAGRPGCLVCHVYLSPTVAWRPERENSEVTATSTSTQLLLLLPLSRANLISGYLENVRNAN